MDKQITPEEKVRIFALYWGQQVLLSPVRKNAPVDLLFMEIVRWDLDKAYLELKDLSSITAQHAIEIGKILDHPADRLIIDKEHVRLYIDDRLNDENPNKNTLIIIWEDYEVFCLDEYGEIYDYDATRLLMLSDYLRQNGFALPALGYSVAKLIAAGVFVIKKEGNNG